MFRLERSQLQTANKRDNLYEKLNKPLWTWLKGFHTFTAIQWSPKATCNNTFPKDTRTQILSHFCPYFQLKIILKSVNDKLGCIAFWLENKYLFCMFLSQIWKQNLSDKFLLNNEVIVFKTCSLRVVFNRFSSRGFFFSNNMSGKNQRRFFFFNKLFCFSSPPEFLQFFPLFRNRLKFVLQTI